LSISLGYPDKEAERRLLMSEDRADMLERVSARLSPEGVMALQEDCEKTFVSDDLLDYIQTMLIETRDPRWFETGLSPRAGLALLRLSRAHAFLDDRDYVIPEDVQAVFPGLARHRLIASSGFDATPDEQIAELMRQVPIP
jgi:MoxR-like ATPase